MSLSINEQDQSVADYLKVLNIKYRAVSLSTSVKDSDGWEHDSWAVFFNDVKFDFNTGIGHRSAFLKPSEKREMSILKELIGYEGGFPQTNELVTINPKNGFRQTANKHAIPPTQADVLYCLLSDTQAGSDTFNDFCDNFGYSNDSISARRTYLACQESGEKLHKVFNYSQLEKLETLLEDY